MKKILVFAVAAMLATPAFAQQQQQAPDDNTPMTITFGDLNKIVSARVADALAQDAMRRLNEQLAAHAPVSKVMPPPPTPPGAPSQAERAPPPLPPLPPK